MPVKVGDCKISMFLLHATLTLNFRLFSFWSSKSDVTSTLKNQCKSATVFFFLDKYLSCGLSTSVSDGWENQFWNTDGFGWVGHFVGHFKGNLFYKHYSSTGHCISFSDFDACQRLLHQTAFVFSQLYLNINLGITDTTKGPCLRHRLRQFWKEQTDIFPRINTDISFELQPPVLSMSCMTSNCHQIKIEVGGN